MPRDLLEDLPTQKRQPVDLLEQEGIDLLSQPVESQAQTPFVMPSGGSYPGERPMPDFIPGYAQGIQNTGIGLANLGISGANKLLPQKTPEWADLVTGRQDRLGAINQLDKASWAPDTDSSRLGQAVGEWFTPGGALLKGIKGLEHFPQIANALAKVRSLTGDGKIVNALGTLGKGSAVGGITGAIQSNPYQQEQGGKFGATVGAGVAAVPAAIPLLSKSPERMVKNALRAIIPKADEVTPKEYEQLVKSGSVQPKSLLKGAKVKPSEREIGHAQKYGDLLQSRDPVKNSQKVMQAISDRDAQVGEFLSANNGIFNTTSLKKHLMERLKPITDISVPSASRLNKAKEDLVDTFISKLSKKDMHSLWQARKQFDRTIEQKFKAFAGTPTLKKDLTRELRDGVQDFIANRTPNGVYRQQMKEMSELFEVNDSLLNKASHEKGKNALGLWMRNNPGKATILGGAAGGYGGNKILSILSSPGE